MIDVAEDGSRFGGRRRWGCRRGGNDRRGDMKIRRRLSLRRLLPKRIRSGRGDVGKSAVCLHRCKRFRARSEMFRCLAPFPAGNCDGYSRFAHGFDRGRVALHRSDKTRPSILRRFYRECRRRGDYRGWRGDNARLPRLIRGRSDGVLWTSNLISEAGAWTGRVWNP